MFSTNRIVTSPPIIAEKIIYFGGWDGSLYAVR